VGLEHIESGTGRRTGQLDLEMAELTGRKPRFQKGDLVYGYLRPYLNKAWVAEFDGLCSVDQYVYEINVAIAEPAYVGWFMRSPVYLERAPISTTPGQLPRIRTHEVAGVELRLPPLEIQQEADVRIQECFASVQAIRHGLRDSTEALEAFRNALFSHAFSGRL